MAWPDGGMRPRLDLRLSQKLLMTPQLQQAIKMLQMSRLEMAQVIQQEMVENPLLEELADEVDGDAVEDAAAAGDGMENVAEQADLTLQSVADGERKPDAEESLGQTAVEDFPYPWEDENNFSDGAEREARGEEDQFTYDRVLCQPTSIVDHLLWQLRLTSLAGVEATIGAEIIGNLDDNGYLALSTEEVAAQCGASDAAVIQVLSVIQGFDPAGIAARTLTECLLIQLAQRGEAESLAAQIVVTHLVSLQKKDYPKIAEHFQSPLAEVMAACRTIASLEPKPCRPFHSAHNPHVVPDASVVQTDAGYTVRLNDDGLPRLKISPFYKKLLRMHDEGNDATRRYLEKKFKSALWLVKSIDQRNRTILKVAQSIVTFQTAFLDHGTDHLRPLVLRDVADDISMHPSTVSRITSNKYLQTPHGIYEMKFFFSSGLNNGADHGSSDAAPTAVRAIIRQMVDEEDPAKPLSDHAIVEALGRQQIAIARRTVAKYRDILRIPSARVRQAAQAEGHS